MKITITNIHFPYSIQLSISMAPYLRLKGNEMLFIFIIYFSIYYICYIHHWGQEKKRLFLLKWYNQRKQTNKGTSECLQTNNSMNCMAEFSYIQVNYLPVWKTKEVLWKHWLKRSWGSNGRVPFIKFLCLVSSGHPRVALSERTLVMMKCSLTTST